MKRNKGSLIVIDGASASGKSTIINCLLEQNEIGFELIKRYVSRLPYGIDDDFNIYDFITYQKFQELIKQDIFAEYQCYKYNMCYGVPINKIVEKIETGKNCIAMISLGNFKMLKNHFPDAIGFFLKVSLSTIEQRLRMRSRHSEEQIQERLNNASKAHNYLKDYDYIIENDGYTPEEVTGEILKKVKNKLNLV